MAGTVTIERSATKQVTCEKCACAYEYEAKRKSTQQVKGSAAMTGGLVGGLAGALVGAAVDAATGNDGEANARGKAQQKAYAKLRTAVDPVACPDCGWYQADMVLEARRRARW